MKQLLRSLETMFAGMGLLIVTLTTLPEVIEWAHSWDGTVFQPFTDRVPLAIVTLGTLGGMIWLCQGAYRLSFGAVIRGSSRRGSTDGA